MLILTRRQYEQIIVGDDVVITVVKCGAGQVKIGVDAPRGAKILRRELLPRDAQEAKRDR